MKIILNILFILISLPIFAQTILENHVVSVSHKTENLEELQAYLITLLQLEENNISLEKTYEIESLTGKHYTFDLKHKDLSIYKAYIKVHANKVGQVYLVQHNYNPELFSQFQSSSIAKDEVYNSLFESFVINEIKEVYILNSENVFTKAVLVNYFLEASDVYKQRIYFNKEDFLEKDLKVHFAPKDTLLKGRAFMPDPLTTSGNEYGVGDFKDDFIKDTSVLIIKTIPNAGQASVSSTMDSFTLYGTQFSIQSRTEQNIFLGPEIYFVFENIYMDVNNQLLGYNTLFIDDTAGFKTNLVKEDYGYAALDNEQFNIEVVGDYSSSAFRLKNAFIEISDFSLPIAPPYSSPINDFSFSRSNKFFEGINAFYHVNNFHDYIENLGFVNLDPTKVLIDVHGNNGADNSFFVNLPSPRLVFGSGGVDDAEDADVVVHEYTHALSYFASPNSNDGAERRAIDEALGDYFCSSYSASFSDFNKYNVFSWDGHNEFWGGRISNSDSTYESLDLSKSIYYNAQIMSSTFMDIFEVTGREVADALILESMYFNVPENNFLNVANNILRADSLLYNEEYKCDIFNVFKNRKVKDGLCVGKTLIDEKGLQVLNSEAFTLGNEAIIVVNEENFQSLDYWISDASGKIIKKELGIQEKYFSVESDLLPVGTYFIRIETNNTKYKTKLLKAK